MRGLTFAGNRKIEFVELPDPTPEEGQVVLEMKASGICGSDLHLYRGNQGMKLAGVESTGVIVRGHEPCGVVAAVGPGVTDSQATVGDRVMVHHYWGCTECEHCQAGWSQMCDRQVPTIYGISAHGGHAQYMSVPAGTLVSLPEELSFEAGAAISCGTGTAYGALMRHGLSDGDTIAVFGQGPVGLAATQLATAMGARVIGVDISAERLELAKKMGADEIVDSSSGDPVEAIRALTGGKGAHHALDASGATEARHAALASLKPWGTLALVGVGGEFSPPLGFLTQKQITVFGSWTFSKSGQAACADFAIKNGVDVDGIFTDRWTLDDAEEAYQKVDAQQSGKGVILM